MEKRLSTETLREVRGILTSHPLSKKYSADELVKLARKKKMFRLYRNLEP